MQPANTIVPVQAANAAYLSAQPPPPIASDNHDRRVRIGVGLSIAAVALALLLLALLVATRHRIKRRRNRKSVRLSAMSDPTSRHICKGAPVSETRHGSAPQASSRASVDAHAAHVASAPAAEVRTQGSSTSLKLADRAATSGSLATLQESAWGTSAVLHSMQSDSDGSAALQLCRGAHPGALAASDSSFMQVSDRLVTESNPTSSLPLQLSESQAVSQAAVQKPGPKEDAGRSRRSREWRQPTSFVRASQKPAQRVSSIEEETAIPRAEQSRRAVAGQEISHRTEPPSEAAGAGLTPEYVFDGPELKQPAIAAAQKTHELPQQQTPLQAQPPTQLPLRPLVQSSKERR